MTNPIISIIIPCYNCEKYLAETLDCLLRQTIDNWEAIIVNDGSTDNSSFIAHKYATQDYRFIIYDQENQGVSAARNNAIKHSTGKYILPLDGDDLIDSTYAEKAIQYLEEHKDTKLVYCKAKYFGAIEKEFNVPSYDFDTLRWGNQIFCSAVFRHEDFDKTSGYDETMRKGYEDWEFWLSFLSKEDKVYRIDECLFFYRQHGASRNSEAMKIHYELAKQIQNKHSELYTNDIERIIEYHNTAEFYRNELARVKESKSYRLGRALLKPFGIIRDLIFSR